MPRRPGHRVASSRPATLNLDGQSIALEIRRSPRARRLHLRVDPADAQVALILPRWVAIEEGLRFVRDKRAWLTERLAAIPARAAFADGAVIPVAGKTLTIRHRPESRGAVERRGGEIVVTGAPEHVGRRVRDWLKALARRELAARSRALAGRIGRPVRSVRIGDPKSRWGSCSARGGLAYSWRLILAPPAVLDYVVAHEVAHLAEHNHGRRFWALVRELSPETEAARSWLRRHGGMLLRYG